MFVIRYRVIIFIATILIVTASITSIVAYGLTWSIEFTGGAVLEVTYPNGRPDMTSVEERVREVYGEPAVFQLAGERGVIIKTANVSEEEQNAILGALSFQGESEIELVRVNTIGPTIGQELRNKAITALVLIILSVVLFIAYAFRTISESVASWKYGITAVLTLIHDLLVPLGVFAALGAFYGYEVDVLVVTALLAIFGYSLSDTIVVFDRIRENLQYAAQYKEKESFERIVGRSLKETYGRSLATSFTTFLALVSLYFFGPVSTQHFALILLIGIVAGTYSSMLLAAPLLVLFKKLQRE